MVNLPFQGSKNTILHTVDLSSKKAKNKSCNYYTRDFIGNQENQAEALNRVWQLDKTDDTLHEIYNQYTEIYNIDQKP